MKLSQELTTISPKSLQKLPNGSHSKQLLNLLVKGSKGDVFNELCRYKDKGGLDDLLKAKHYLEMLIESMGPKSVDFEYSVTNKS